MANGDTPIPTKFGKNNTIKWKYKGNDDKE